MCISFQVVVSFVYWTSTVSGVRTRCIGQWSHCISEMPKQSFLYSNPYLWLVRCKYTKSKFRIEWYLYSGNSWLSYRYLVCNSNLWSMAICTNCLAFWGGVRKAAAVAKTKYSPVHQKTPANNNRVCSTPPKRRLKLRLGPPPTGSGTAPDERGGWL